MDKSSALDYINQMFPTEASLSCVEPLMQKIHGEIRRVDAGILAAVRQQSNSGTKAKEDLAAATHAVEELMYKIREIKSKAEQSETVVQEICRDIKKLDFAKKHITTTITALHRLTMLVSAVEQLQVMASKRQYKEAAAQLEAVNQLCSHFEAYKDIPKITELREKFKNIRQILKSHVFSDFSSLGTGKETEESNLLQQLADACLVVDALEPSVREELVKNFCSRELTSYRQIFEGAGLHLGLILFLPSHIWTQIVEILDNLKEKPDVGTLLLALQRTLEFEEELADKFGAGTRSKEAGNDFEDTGETNNQAISDIRKKYEKKLAAHQGSESKMAILFPASILIMPYNFLLLGKRWTKRFIGTRSWGFQLIKLAAENYLSALMWQFNFRGIISSCFEPHMAVYVELEEKTLMENLEKLVQEETWDIEEGTQTNILSSSMQVFLIIRRSLKRCSALTKNQTLLNLFKVFQRVLKAYATKLFTRLPKGGTGIVAAATGMDGQIKTSDRDERLICYIINTAEYCHKTDEFSAVITKALVTLVHGLETKFDAEMAAMTRIPWATLESVGDQSAYINSINTILTSSIPVLGRLLSPIYFQFFLDKLASSLGPRFYLNIFKCKQISETGAQQPYLKGICLHEYQDVVGHSGYKDHSSGYSPPWKTGEFILVNNMNSLTSGASNYSKFVSREMSKAEALLKVILSPIDSVADTYRALLPEGTPSEFQRILELKGLKRADQQSILDDFDKRGPEISQPPPAPPVLLAVPTAPPAPTIANPSSAGVIASREDVLTRAAALGRGAATTGFKRFLALTEAAKDRKDGPFRKLFNP
ncbi:hypothetical protein RHMOL_Rhmol05G0224700 [Rhododendron molle]|uniref:Uncharacterized protein n=1 Tax=Rhododendron molle TaxID=49168 RepID=A0ACC0NS11_RHOML|nr:hypothetical protein RHMOL_Rhmol05G0224700 [Rhododendron molle]